MSARTEHGTGLLIENRWNEEQAAAMSPQELLLYRSRLLGADKRVTNFGGGNTSAKLRMPDPLTGEAVEVLWVKGSGGDLGTMGLDGFATLYLEKNFQPFYANNPRAPASADARRMLELLTASFEE